ncbi:hydroxyethylthiazole kinase [Christensenellaceae bacterium NSJ-53]|uniref:Hydroxyethylthiazole kinase n=2 Tax=Gehongia tenuis TaxID=2763655 RepID=A0A926HQJ7_9FIRM|nr:hydroxyethylthiazole kinase [Gehongia tenuis]
MLQNAGRILQAIPGLKPIVHCITNYVTVNGCANIVLACGASPIMAQNVAEVEEVASFAKALVLNIGTVDNVEAMVLAGKKAKSLGTPVIFDPVGAGATSLRNRTAERILKEVKPDIIRGNMSEVRTLGGLAASTKGVDAAAEDSAGIGTSAKMLRDIAKDLNAVVVATGVKDLVSDGRRVYHIENGHSMMAYVTGTGCMLSTMTAAYAAAAGKEGYLAAAIGATAAMGIAGEMAYEAVMTLGAGVGTFQQKLFDAIFAMDASTLLERGKVYEDTV